MHSLDTWLAIAVFALVSSITPGPNNLMLATAGVNVGVRRSLPHIAGIILGFIGLLVAVGLGVGEAMRAAPWLQNVLRAGGVAWLLWYAWKIARARPPAQNLDGARGDGRGAPPVLPMSLWQAAAFQWINVKAWLMAIAAMAIYVRPDHPWLDVAQVTVIFAIASIPCLMAWLLVGNMLRKPLSDPRRLRMFNGVMALLLVLSALPILRDLAQAW